jgi:hypothetical protein
VAAVLLFLSPTVAQEKKKAPANELDAFMEKALQRREVNRKLLNDYVLDEAETFDVLGPGRMRLYRARREYMWFVRDGIHVRSPLRYDGVTIPEDERRRYEQRWIERQQRRAKREAERQAKKNEKGKTEPPEVDDKPSAPASPLPEPAFVSDAYFMEFKFEPGNYYLAGRERLEDHDVLKIEYYPTNLFDDGPEDGGVRGGRDEPKDAKISRQMNKTSLVTLWVDPTEHQIVKYTFDNVWLDFLPAAWLMRVDALKASMVMGQPFTGVWLPRAINISAGMTLANGSYEATYSREFSDYRQADVKTTIRIPKPGQP